MVLLLCTLSLSAFCQANLFDVGVEGGFNVSSLRGSEIFDDHTSAIGYSGGLSFQYNFKKIFSLRTGGYFERKGSSFYYEVRSASGGKLGTADGKEKFDYLTVPVLVRATFGNKLAYFFNAGPYFGFLLKQVEHIDGYHDSPETNDDHTDFYKGTETGLSVGLGLAYVLKEKFALSFEARNNLGLTNTSAVEIYDGGSIKTNALNFLLGFSYKLGQRKSEAK